MTKRMLIDANHPEETRVVVVSGNRLEEFDYEPAAKKQLKGNIYLAKVTRVEPSLQAAFVEYGGNRHGFLAFSEIHPDYYRIPIADREALKAAQGFDDHDLDVDDEDDLDDNDDDRPDLDTAAETDGAEVEDIGDDASSDEPSDTPDKVQAGGAEAPPPPVDGDAPEVSSGDGGSSDDTTAILGGDPNPAAIVDALSETGEAGEENGKRAGADGDTAEVDAADAEAKPAPRRRRARTRSKASAAHNVEEVNEDSAPRRRSYARRYKIQEVIKRRQILLVQVTKEERGNKGAALTTYLSLAGRYCVLMPNTARGGGISRKIGSATDRKRLKSLVSDLEIPQGMAVIVRTAGAERSKAEIKRDYDYLLRLWEKIRQTTLTSSAPCLVHEEGDLIKRSIRDLYTRDIEEVLVEGEEGYRTAKNFMRMLMPSHAKRVQRYVDNEGVPSFHRHQVETQLDAIHFPSVQLRSGGYIVIHPTEALVSIDVNSGRSTKERHIEETALKTNLEAAEEIARQLRLRDLAGLVVIDFIDMEDNRHNAQVEKRLRDAMRNDRARLQLGRISTFGLLELSRQRLRPSLAETTTDVCPHCGGTGSIRSTDSTALHVLRALEGEGLKRRASEITVFVPTRIALYVLNHKRDAMQAIEARHDLTIMVQGDDSLVPPDYRIERTAARVADDTQAPTESAPERAPEPADETDTTQTQDTRAQDTRAQDTQAQEGEGDGNGRRRRRRRGRGRRQDNDNTQETAAETAAETESETAEDEGQAASGNDGAQQEDDSDDSAGRRRRRGRRGGRRRQRRGAEGDETEVQAEGSDPQSPPPDPGAGDQPDIPASYAPRLPIGQAETFVDPAAVDPASSPQPEIGISARAAAEPEPASGDTVDAEQSESTGPKKSEAAEPSSPGNGADASHGSGPGNGAVEPRPNDEPVQERPVMREVVSADGDVEAEAETTSNTHDPDQGKQRRGWWQRLME